MSKAFKCDHCTEYFSKPYGSHVFEGEVCDAKGGWVRYRVKAFVFGSKGGGHDYCESDKELCESCTLTIVSAALIKRKL